MSITAVPAVGIHPSLPASTTATTRIRPLVSAASNQPSLQFSGRFRPKNPMQAPDADYLMRQVNALSDLSRTQGDTAAHLKKELSTLGLTVRTQPFTAPPQNFDGPDLPYENLIVSFGPKTGKRLIIGSHYDAAHPQDRNGVYPAADYSASGVAGLLTLARMLKQHAPTLTHPVDLVAYATEELPYVRLNYQGSAVHADSLKQAQTPVAGMLSLDMIGYFSDQPGSQQYPIGLMRRLYGDKGNFIAVTGGLGSLPFILKVAKGLKHHTGIDVRAMAAPGFLPGVMASDHRHYGPSAVITDTAFYRNSRHYNRRSDTAETLNPQKMTQVVQGMYHLIANYA